MQRSGNGVVVTLGALTSGTVKTGVKKGDDDLVAVDRGRPTSPATPSRPPVTESGANDRDF